MPRRGPVFPIHTSLEDDASQEFSGEFSAHQGIYIPPATRDTIIDTSPFHEGTLPHGIPMDWLDYQQLRRAFQTRPDDAALATAQYGNRCLKCGRDGECMEHMQCPERVFYGEAGQCQNDTACQYRQHELMPERIPRIFPNFMHSSFSGPLPGFVAEQMPDMISQM